MFENLRTSLATMLVGKAPTGTNPGDGTGVSIIGNNTTLAPKLGTPQLLAIYNESPWLRAVVRKVAVGVAGTQWRLYVKQNSQKKAVRHKGLQNASYDVRKEMMKNMKVTDGLREIEEHPLIDLLQVGNPELHGQSVLQTTQVHIDLVGEGFWIKERNGLGVPTALWPIPPDWIRKLPTKSQPYFHLSSSAGSQVADVPVTEVIYFKEPDPANPYGRGSGTGKSLGDEIEIDEFAAKHIKSFFINRARPDLIISGDSLSRADSERLEELWNQKHKGFWKAWKPMFLSRKVDVKTLSQSFENMQMTDLRKQERDAFY